MLKEFDVIKTGLLVILTLVVDIFIDVYMQYHFFFDFKLIVGAQMQTNSLKLTGMAVKHCGIWHFGTSKMKSETNLSTTIIVNSYA